MKNYLLIAIVCFIGFAGCSKGSTVNPKISQSQPTLSEQKMCADQAAKTFKENYDPPSTYTDHYDAASQVCYIEVTHRLYLDRKGDFGRTNTIYDAFEARSYGEFASRREAGKPPTPPYPCSIKPRGHEEITCQSQDEFDALALKYFGTTAD